MENLTQEKLQYLKNLLSQREQILRDDIRREGHLQDDNARVASDTPDADVVAFSDLSADFGNAAVARDLHELRAIQIARTRMENDVYGECAECGYAIPYKRLQAQPIAERCAPCQEIYEKTHVDV